MNTGDLYSGMTSGSFGTNKAAKKQRQAIQTKNEELKATIAPAYKQLIDDIDAEIARLTNISQFMTGTYVTDDQTRFELAARKRYIDYLTALKLKYLNTTKGNSSER